MLIIPSKAKHENPTKIHQTYSANIANHMIEKLAIDAKILYYKNSEKQELIT